jgi:putative flippase GtrA
MLGIATIARQLLLTIEVGPLIAGAVAHALGIGLAAIINYLGHRHLTFTRAAPRPR